MQLTKVEGEQLTKPCNTGPAEDPGRRSYRRLLGVSLCVTNIGYILADLSCQVVARVETRIVTGAADDPSVSQSVFTNNHGEGPY